MKTKYCLILSLVAMLTGCFSGQGGQSPRPNSSNDSSEKTPTPSSSSDSSYNEGSVQQKTTYLVTFIVNGGSYVPNQRVEEGERIIRPDDPYKEGYSFNYWSYNSEEWDFDTRVYSNITLVAEWIENVEPSILLDINEFYSLETNEEGELYSPYEGEIVTIQDQTIYAYHGRTVYGSCIDGDYYRNLHGLEIQLAEDFAFTWADSVRDLVNVTGRVHYDGAKCVLTDATWVVTEDGVKDSYSWNHPCYCCPSDIMTRSWIDACSGTYMMHGVLNEGVFQLASVPTFTAGQNADFYVVFPGEDGDLTDEDNLAPMKVTVPADLEAATLTALQEAFEGLEVGDFIYMLSLFNYTSEGVGFILENYWGLYVEETTASVIRTWEDVSAEISSIYNEKVPDLGIDEFALSYSVNTSYARYTLDNLWDDPSELGFTDDMVANWALTDITINVKQSKAEESAAALGAKFADAGFESLGSNEGDEYKFTEWALNVGEDEEAEPTAIVFEFDRPSSIELYYVAARKIVDLADDDRQAACAQCLSDILCGLMDNDTYTPEWLIQNEYISDNTDDEEEPCWYGDVNFGTSVTSEALAECVPQILTAYNGYTTLQDMDQSQTDVYVGCYQLADYADVVLVVYCYTNSSGAACVQVCAYNAESF